VEDETRSTLGIDEAGRGAQIGPLVLAGVLVDVAQAAALLERGLRDSKPLSRARRAAIADAIRATAAWVGVEVRTAADVDGYVRAGGRAGRTLNVLERRMAASLIRRAPGSSRIVADGRALFRALERRRPLLTARDHADDTEPAVMAAAIIAKVERDRLLALLEKECVSLCGFIPRGGYPGPETTAWIARHRAFFGSLPASTRATWGRRYLPPIRTESSG
jgi:ribonuclease HII